MITRIKVRVIMLGVGWHLFGELYGCPKELLMRLGPVKEIMERTVEEAGLKPVGDVFHQYEPFGVTGVILISASHFSIHTWPEHNYAAVDIFSCSNEGDPERTFEILCKHLKPRNFSKRLLER